MKRVRRWTGVLSIAVGLAIGATALPAQATPESALLYDYDFTTVTGVGTSTVANSAPLGPVLPLTLAGGWTPAADGVAFAGNTLGVDSLAYATPAAGYTINAPATSSVGVGARFRYTAPASGSCFGDTPNITQIGRFGARQAQAKIQLSKCADNPSDVNVECRFAGAATPVSVLPVRNTLPLVDGDTYVATCQKMADGPARTTSVVLTVTQLDPVPGDVTTSTTFTVANLGAMISKRAISVANKFPLPVPAKNTDQFVGDVASTAYCVGVADDVTGCLASNLPLS